MQEKISISVDKELVKKADGLIDCINIKKRSQAFEKILRSYFNKAGVEKAIILLARQQKLNGSFMANNLMKLGKIGISEVIIAAGAHNAEITKQINATAYSFKISCLNEDELKGTAGAIKLAQDIVSSPFLVMAGDTLFDFDLKSMIEFHNNSNSLATIGLTTTSLKKSTDNIEVEGNKIISFEYRGNSNTYLTNAGIYIFNQEIFRYLPKKGSLENDVFPRLCRENKLSAFLLDNKMVKIL